jgi:hypothetical protein
MNKELFNQMSFDPYNCSLKIQESRPLKLQLPNVCVGSFLHTLLHSQEYEMWLPNFILGLHLKVDKCLEFSKCFYNYGLGEP